MQVNNWKFITNTFIPVDYPTIEYLTKDMYIQLQQRFSTFTTVVDDDYIYLCSVETSTLAKRPIACILDVKNKTILNHLLLSNIVLNMRYKWQRELYEYLKLINM